MIRLPPLPPFVDTNMKSQRKYIPLQGNYHYRKRKENIASYKLSSKSHRSCDEDGS